MNKSIGILDYGVGNVKSIQNILWSIDINSKVVSSSKELLKVDKIILPGVGAFDSAITNLQERKLINEIRSFSESGEILGICLGMQILASTSEEGCLDGLDLIDGQVKQFDTDQCTVPHIGWNNVSFKKDTLFFDEAKDFRFYFVHSYFFECNDEDSIIGTTSHGIDFPSVVKNIDNNVYGCQFHPEKSHNFGKKFLTTFCSK